MDFDHAYARDGQLRVVADVTLAAVNKDGERAVRRDRNGTVVAVSARCEVGLAWVLLERDTRGRAEPEVLVLQRERCDLRSRGVGDGGLVPAGYE